MDPPHGDNNLKILAIANHEAHFRYFIQIHHESALLIDEVIRWIEEHCSNQKSEKDAKQTLSIVALEGSTLREKALEKHGFSKENIYGIQRLRDINESIPNYKLPESFKIKSVNPETDFDELAKAIRTVFNHGDWFNKKILEKISSASFYLKDLDLIAVDQKNQKIASFCTFRYDKPSGITELEPMGTLPEYRQKGLAKALLCEGFRRLKKHNPTLLYIDGAANTPAANQLYELTGFTKNKITISGINQYENSIIIAIKWNK